MTSVYASPVRTCSRRGCGRGVFARGLCHTHYEFARMHGELDRYPRRLSPSHAYPIPVWVRVSRAAARALVARGPSVGLAAREVIEEWAEHGAKRGRKP